MPRWAFAAATRTLSGAGFGVVRAMRRWAVLALLLLIALPGESRAYTTCSPYMGQVVVNEVRIGKSNKSVIANQVEFFNIGGAVPASVWQSSSSRWKVVVYGGNSASQASLKGTYFLDTAFVSSGDFIYSNGTNAMWARNGDNNNKPRAFDLALLDGNGYLVAYIAIGVGVQAIPACYSSYDSNRTIKASSGSDNTGDLMRPTDGTGTWPTPVPTIPYNTIGRTNACNISGADINVSMAADVTKAIQAATPITYSVSVFNNACSATANSVTVITTNTNATYLSGLATLAGTGSVALTSGGSGHTWTVGSLAAGASGTLTISGKGISIGTLTTTAVGSSTSTLYNTIDDRDTESVSIQQYNYVGFSAIPGATATVTEGTDTSYSATLELDVASTKAVTVNFSIGGTATAGTDYTPLVTSPVTIASGSTSVTIDFTLIDNTIYTGTNTIVITITSVSSTDSTVRIGVTGNGNILTHTITRHDDDPPLDHYELVVPSTGVACLASTVQVRACSTSASGASCSAATSISGNATLSTSAGSLAATTLALSSGTGSTTLSYIGAGTGSNATVLLAGVPVAAVNPTQCCLDGSSCSAASSCTITFTSAGFIVAAAANGSSTTLPTQTAGTASSTYTLRAVKTNTSTKACEAAISGSTAVDWAYQCNNPATCSSGNRMVLTGNSATLIAANPNGSVGSTLSVPMTFDSNGNAPFSFNYSDVGQVTLYATKAASGALLTTLAGSSNAFVVKPAGFVLSNIKCTGYAAGTCATASVASPGNNPGASTAAGSAFIQAGQAFSATVTAIDSTNGAVPNFGKETSPEGVTLTPTLVLPTVASGGTAGTLGGSFGSFTGGAATGTAFSYSEVGIVSLAPSLTSASYLGTGSAINGTASGNVGRFIPNHFTTTVAPGCSGSFTYSGQAMTARITARNAAGTAVQNYSGSTGFSKAVTLSDAPVLGVGGFGATSAVAASLFAAGVATSSAPTYTFTSKLTAARGLIVRAADTDAVGSSGFAEGTTELRSGRLRLSNAFGSEKTALIVPVQAQYWSGSTWVANTADSCTTVPAAAVVRASYIDNKGAASSGWSSSASAIVISAGAGSLTLGAPSPSSTGSLDFALNLGSTTTDQSCLAAHPASTGAALPWLRSQNGACGSAWANDPSARASFGIYTPETRKTLHVREIF